MPVSARLFQSHMEAATRVLGLGYGLQVGRVAAPRGATKVVQVKALGDGPYVKFIRDSMCARSGALAAEPDLPIAVLADMTAPKPAASGRIADDLRLEALAQRASTVDAMFGA